MKSMMVYEVVKVRRMSEQGWSDWKEMNNDFDVIIKKIEKDSKTSWSDFQVAKFYYDKENKYVAWNYGVKICHGQVYEIF